MLDKPRILYWDSAVFLSHLNGIPGRQEIIQDVITEIAEDKRSIIYTSSVSIVEVTHVQHEKEKWRLDPVAEEAINRMWEDKSVIRIADDGVHIAEMAKKLIRDAIPNEWSLKPKDATHLATAAWLDKNVNPISEFNTYDKKLFKYGPMIGIHICEPHVLQVRMNLKDKEIENREENKEDMPASE